MTSESSRGEMLTEEELLGDSETVHLDDLDEDALLSYEPPIDFSIEPKEKLPDKEINEEQDKDSHVEELDYGEDEETEDDQETRNKFTSERIKPSQSAQSIVATSTSISSTSAISTTSMSSVGNSLKGKRQQNLPSLLNMDVRPPPVLSIGKIHVNPSIHPNFVPPPVPLQQPQVRLTIPGIPTITMPPPMPMPSLMPRMPGLPPQFMAMPPNHGVAGFGPPPMHPALMNPADGWNNRVSAFLSTVGKRRRRRSSSYSTSSSSSRSRSRSSSRSRRHHSSSRRDRRRSDERRRERSRDRRDDRRDRYSKNRKSDGHRSRNEKEVTEECAKAVGVDTDYMNKLEEQKRKREELVREKEKRRFGGAESTGKTSEDDKSHKRAYLCVTIKNITHLENAPVRIGKLAAEIGTVIKCWQFSDDQVNLIFKDHSNAKGFLLKYNNKVMTGVRLQISLEKGFFNLSEIK